MLKPIELSEIKRVLFIQPHPDDNEIGAGGLMAKLVKQGAQVFSLTVTKGDGGSQAIAPKELAVIRQQEAQLASDILGVTYLGCLDFDNRNPGTIESICEAIVKVLREHPVDTVISVDPDLKNECHPVHLSVGRAVNEAFTRCPQVFYPFHEEKRHEEAYAPANLGHYFTLDYTHVIDTDDVYSLKMEAIQAHQTQMSPEFVATLDELYHQLAQGQPFATAERIKLLRRVQTHAFAIE